MARRDIALLVLLGAAWGSVYPLTAVALDDLGAPAVVVARTGFAALLLVPLALYRGVAAAVRVRLPAVALAGLLQATIPLVLLTAGQEHLASGVAGILAATQPVWATVITAGLDRAVNGAQAVGVALGLCGVIVLFSDNLHGDSSVMGGALVLAAALFYAIGSVYIQRAIPEVPPLATATVAMVLSAALLTPFATSAAAPRLDRQALIWLAVLGVISTGVALVAFYSLIQRTGAIRANLVAYLAPAFAVVYGAALLDEDVRPPALVGLALILAGAYVAGRSSDEALSTFDDGLDLDVGRSRDSGR